MEIQVRAQYAAAQATLPDVTPITVLHIGAAHTVLAWAPDRFAVLALGSETTAARFFQHTPPTSLELERAIDVVEDELMKVRALTGDTTALFTTDPMIARIALVAGVQKPPVVQLPREQVERTFDRLAAVAQGRPASVEGLPADPAFAATLLILRESMHHLDFMSITIEA